MSFAMVGTPLTVAPSVKSALRSCPVKSATAFDQNGALSFTLEIVPLPAPRDNPANLSFALSVILSKAGSLAPEPPHKCQPHLHLLFRSLRTMMG